MQRPAATSALEAWKAPASGRRGRTALEADLQALAFRQQGALHQAQTLALLADAHHALAGADGGGREGRVAVGIAVQHRRAAARQQGLEQPQLGGAVGAHGAVIVQMVLGQV